MNGRNKSPPDWNPYHDAFIDQVVQQCYGGYDFHLINPARTASRLSGTDDPQGRRIQRYQKGTKKPPYVPTEMWRTFSQKVRDAHTSAWRLNVAVEIVKAKRRGVQVRPMHSVVESIAVAAVERRAAAIHDRILLIFGMAQGSSITRVTWTPPHCQVICIPREIAMHERHGGEFVCQHLRVRQTLLWAALPALAALDTSGHARKSGPPGKRRKQELQAQLVWTAFEKIANEVINADSHVAIQWPPYARSGIGPRSPSSFSGTR